MRPSLITLAAATLALTSTTALTQDKGWFVKSTNESGNPAVDVDIPSRTAAEFYNELGLTFDGEFNFVVQSGVDLVILPPIRLRNVDVFDLIHLPESMADGLMVQSITSGQPLVPGRTSATAYLYVVSVDPGALDEYEREAGQDSIEMRFDLRFEGGTALGYVNAIREAYPGANILAMPGLEGFVVPAVNLDGVTVDAALVSIEGQEAMVDGAWAKVRLSDADIEGREERVFTISLERHENEEQTKIWSVGNTLAQGVAEADLLSAVKAALDLNQQEATVRFHPETNLLMVRGRRDAVKTAEETLQQVQRGAGDQVRTQFHWSNQQTVDDLLARIVELERRLGVRDGD